MEISTMKIKETCWAFFGTLMTLFIGYMLFYGVDQRYSSESEKNAFYFVSFLAVGVMSFLTAIGWSVALPDKENDNDK